MKKNIRYAIHNRKTFLLSACTAYLFFLASGTPLYAQLDTIEVFKFPLTAETRPRLIEICARLSSRPVVKGAFEQTKTISRLNRSLISKGNFIIASDQGMVWETVAPFPSTVAMGRDYLIQLNPSGTKTKLEAAGNETFLRLADTISAVFSGDSRKLIGSFENYFSESGGIWTLGLIPLETPIRSFAARIVMQGDSVIRFITLYEQNGDTIRYALSNHTFPGGLSAGEKNLFSLQ